ELADRGAQCRTHGLVALPRLLVGAVALDLGLDVRHAETTSVSACLMGEKFCRRCADTPVRCVTPTPVIENTRTGGQAPNPGGRRGRIGCPGPGRVVIASGAPRSQAIPCGENARRGASNHYQ